MMIASRVMVVSWIVVSIGGLLMHVVMLMRAWKSFDTIQRRQPKEDWLRIVARGRLRRYIYRVFMSYTFVLLGMHALGVDRVMSIDQLVPGWIFTAVTLGWYCNVFLDSREDVQLEIQMRKNAASMDKAGIPHGRLDD